MVDWDRLGAVFLIYTALVSMASAGFTLCLVELSRWL
jgi:hypothetical protein